MGEEVEQQEFSRADRTRYREKVRRCLDVFARMLREARFDTDDPMTGLEVELNLVDDNGDPALRNAEALAAIADPAFQTELGVTWFEEPVYHHDHEGLRLLRDRGPAGMDIAAGEYAYDTEYFRHLLDAGAVDVLQADATRCMGITGLLLAAALCEAHFLALSAHCAPSIHAHPGCAILPMRHLEYFHDHARIEHMLFDGVLTPQDGALYPNLSRPGNGLEFKHADAARYAV